MIECPLLPHGDHSLLGQADICRYWNPFLANQNNASFINCRSGKECEFQHLTQNAFKDFCSLKIKNPKELKEIALEYLGWQNFACSNYAFHELIVLYPKEEKEHLV